MAAKALGRALAEQSFGLVVYSGDQNYIEPFFVSGYISSNKATSESIVVVYPRNAPRPSFAEQEQAMSCFKFKVDQNPNWEVSFYRSLYHADGIVLIGGGQATFAAGIFAAALAIPMLPLEVFGGAAAKVWELIAPAEGLVRDEDKSALASKEPITELWANDLVRRLKDQIDRRKQKGLMETRARKRRNSSRILQVVVGAALLISSIGLFVLTWDAQVSRTTLLTAIAAAPALAGGAASVVRSLWEAISETDSTSENSVWPMAFLGGVAGAISGLLYVIAQLTALLPGEGGQLAPVAGRLVPFALLTGFLAGFATDAFFRRLREQDVPAVQVPGFQAPTTERSPPPR